jgi:hypothetical protein
MTQWQQIPPSTSPWQQASPSMTQLPFMPPPPSERQERDVMANYNIPAVAVDPKSVKQQLEDIFKHVYRKDYQPPLGWDPSTGEPWMAVRCYANLAYASLVGNQGYI